MPAVCFGWIMKYLDGCEMKILVTGSQGSIGRLLVKTLLGAGHTIRSFDQVAREKNATWDHLPGDIRNIEHVRRAVEGMDVVIHLAAILTDTTADQERIYSVNIQGTWNILMACVEAGVTRLINFSSIQALGHSNSAHTAIYFPLNDQVPKQPASPYQISKHVAEEICQGFIAQSEGTFHHDLSIVTLRPTFVFNPENYKPDTNPHRIWNQLSDEALTQFGKKDYWSFVHVQDVCQAACLALTAPIVGHQAFLLTSDYTWAKAPTIELVNRYYPHFRWKNTTPEDYFKDNTFRSLIDCSNARRALGWHPEFSQREAILSTFNRN